MKPAPFTYLRPDTVDEVLEVLQQYGADTPDHPMTSILKDGLIKMEQPQRRGGWRSRPRN